MRKQSTRVFLIMAAVLLASCGGSSNDNSSLLDSALDVMNKNTGPTHTHSSIIKSNGEARSVGCTEAFLATREEIRTFTEKETEYALCGRQDNENRNSLCMYPSVDAFRTLETADSVGATQDIITIQLANGRVEVSLTNTNSQFEYEFQAENNASECTSNTRPDVTYSDADIDGNYAVTVIKVDQNGVPKTHSSESISCAKGACTGGFYISDMKFSSANEAWVGKINFEGAQLELYATLSPNKQVAVFAGCPFSSLATQDLVEECVFIGAHRF